jgi:hypothetical protein
MIACVSVQGQDELFDHDYVNFVDSVQFAQWQQELGKWNEADCQPMSFSPEDNRWKYNVYSDVQENGFNDRYTYYFDKSKVYRVALASVTGNQQKWLDDNLKFVEKKEKDGNTYRYYDAVSYRVVMVKKKGKYVYWCELPPSP